MTTHTRTCLDSNRFGDGFECICENCPTIPRPAPSEGVNPKDAIAATKPDVSLVPPALILHTARAMENGAAKYGPFNWRDQGKSIRARVYVAAAIRHLSQWLDGEETASDSGAHHLGHAAACCGILLDAQAGGWLKDDRPPPGPSTAIINTRHKKVTQ